MLMVTGKKDRNAAIAATATHNGSRALPAHRTTIGAIASSGTV